MKVNIFNKLKIKVRNLSNITLVVILMLLTVTAIISFFSIGKPTHQSSNITRDTVTQKTAFAYSSDPLPDGIISVDNKIFTKLQEKLKLQISSVVTSNEPLNVLGSCIVYYDIISEGIWKQSVPLSSKVNIDSKGTNNKILNLNLEINLTDISSRIDKAEKNMGPSQGNYTIKIRPDIQADIIYKDRKIPVDNTAELNFQYSYGQMKLMSKDKEFTKSSPITELQTTMLNDYNVLGISLPVVFCKYVCPAAAVLFLMLLLLNKKSIQKKRGKNMTYWKNIDKKYNDRLVNLKVKPDFENKLLLSVSSFKELLQLADEKELSLLRFQNPSSRLVNYYTIDGSCIFSYTTSKFEEKTEQDLKNIVLGSDSLNG